SVDESPHSVQPLVHSPRPFGAPGSHSSTPVRTRPSPHVAQLQPLRQLSVSDWLPSSQASLGSSVPLPQVGAAAVISTTQCWLQPSPSFRLPSSHCSTNS